VYTRQLGFEVRGPLATRPLRLLGVAPPPLQSQGPQPVAHSGCWVLVSQRPGPPPNGDPPAVLYQHLDNCAAQPPWLECQPDLNGVWNRAGPTQTVGSEVGGIFGSRMNVE